MLVDLCGAGQYKIMSLQHADFTSTHMSEGSGSLEFRLVNMRAEVIFGFFRSGKQCTCLEQECIHGVLIPHTVGWSWHMAQPVIKESHFLTT